MAEQGSNKWLVAVAVALGALLEIIDTSIVNVALTDMQASLGATLTQITWVITSYAIANVIILPLSAWLGNRFGKKKYFIFSLVGFTAASMLCGMSTTLWMLTVARVLQGLFGGGLLAKAQAILFETFPREEQAMAQGFFGAIVIAGPVIGPTLGGYIVTNINWRWIFFINLPVGIAATFMCVTALPADKKKTGPNAPVDWLAIALLAIGIGCFQTFLEEGYTDDWFESPFVTTMAILGGLGMVLFVFRVLGAKDPVVDLRVLRYRSLWAGSILSVVVGMALYGALFAIPIFSQNVMHYTSQQTGVLLLPGALTSAFAMPIVAILIRKFDPRIVLVGGGLILASAVVLLAQLTPSTGSDDLFWPLVIRAFGTVLMFLPLSMSALGPIPKEDVAGATALFNLTRQLGGSVGVALLTTILGNRQTFHRSVLIEHLAVTDPDVQSRVAQLTGGFVAKGADLLKAKQMALTILDGSTRIQSSVMAFNDTFWITATLIVITLPLVLLLGKPPKGVKVEAGH
ncbi:Inner membrane component of tripartite multidrug resistance system [Labilithrix luteola]|uniref:Inner membrane component of tripartite multidrug resistance system n=1 Tax=Labilithrix luteola TaxID=1391654 RepID=A0A0K1Q6K8_9BACT|nr:DHA2 family efflux MFS transporter permease subunit [Labilithrix luteola]AKV01277.1 Inner membrane component of tripartite multidrug resistance system [Labilithrix luteola]